MSPREHPGIAPRRVVFDWSRTPAPDPLPRRELAARRLATAGFTKYVDFLSERLLGERPLRDAPIPRREWLRFRLAVVAVIEQFAAVLGDWVLAAEGPDRADADEVMLDLLRRHGAEEVEHRAIAFDLYQHCGGTGAPRYARRIAGLAVTAPVMLDMWLWGTAYLMRHDPELADRSRYSLTAHHQAVRQGLLPSWRELGATIPRYPRRSYHPSREGSLSRAVEYLRRSPAARAAS
ncbi:metal-dependent hydrolase [Streptomyces sp. NPDC002838]|uniref:metal-dependent hydrolase n=1 Tax=Streptomyces sp. NPDC002838 TaxID=3154436 RepID=UPI0033287D3D